MSRLTDLLRAAKQVDPQLGKDLEDEIRPLQERLPFGLNFERHAPEAVELAGHKIRRGSKVRVLSPRGESGRGDQRLWRVVTVTGNSAGISLLDDSQDDVAIVNLDDLILVAEFRDRVYPGLRPDGTVEGGGDKPFHTVINGENFHVLEQLTFTHEKSVDAIYIDPPYNTGARDWKYNNDYVEDDDLYRHSKWLAFMERRLRLAKRLLNPEDSVLIATIDEKEVNRFGLLLGQTFPGARIQQVASVISSQASVREGSFARCDETLYFVMLGRAAVGRSEDDMLNEGLSSTKSQLWFQYVRTGSGNLRSDRKSMFFPIFCDPKTGRIHSIGDVLPLGLDKATITPPAGTVAIWPETSDGREGRWRTGPDVARQRAERGLLRLGHSSNKRLGWSVMSVNAGTERRIDSGEVVVDGRDSTGGARLQEVSGNTLRNPKTVWNKISHNAGWHGSKLVASLIPGRDFPFPKSLYAVEDALRFFITDKPDAVVLDFFAGSGTTAHAVMRLNRQDAGRRQCISVTNNEVSAQEQIGLRRKSLRPGDPEWEQLGICAYVTEPRLRAAITGNTPEGTPIKGHYRFTDEFPMADGFEENATFFTLTYESPWMVSTDRAFAAIAPMLWLRAGATGRRIDTISSGWEVADSYGIVKDLDLSAEFIAAIKAAERVQVAYIVTDDEGRYQQIANEIPGVETVRLYEDYLRNCESTGDI